MQGLAPEHVDPSYYDQKHPVIYGEMETSPAMPFAACLQIIADGGTVTAGLIVREANAVTLLFSASTSFKGFDQMPGTNINEVIERVYGTLDALKNSSYAELQERHIIDYQSLFNRGTRYTGSDR